MSARPLFHVLAIWLALAGPAAAQVQTRDEPKSDLFAARSLKCEFRVSAAADWRSGIPNVTIEREKLDPHCDSIDLRARRNAGASDVGAYATPQGLHFIEETIVGNIILTTVFAYRASDGGFIAVTSRHINFQTSPLPSQYHGVCKVWE